MTKEWVCECPVFHYTYNIIFLVDLPFSKAWCKWAREEQGCEIPVYHIVTLTPPYLNSCCRGLHQVFAAMGCKKGDWPPFAKMAAVASFRVGDLQLPSLQRAAWIAFVVQWGNGSGGVCWWLQTGWGCLLMTHKAGQLAKMLSQPISSKH